MVLLKVHYDDSIVILSWAVAFMGVYTAVSLSEQYRLLSSVVTQSEAKLWGLIFMTAVSFGGIGIWCLHFTVVSALSITLDDEVIPIRYNTGMLMASLIVVTILQVIGLLVASTDTCFNKSKKEIVELFIARASTTYTMNEIKKMGKTKILFIVCTYNLHRILLGGVISASGVIVMHYMGMMAMEFQGHVRYTGGIVFITVIVALVSAMLGYFTFYRLLSIFPSLDILRVAIAINGMIFSAQTHFIGLFSGTYVYDSDKPAVVSSENSISAYHLLVGTLVTTVIFCLVMQIFVLSDLRAWLVRTSSQLHQADKVIDAMIQQHVDQHGSDPPSRDLINYFHKCNRRLPTATSADQSTALVDEAHPDIKLRNVSLYYDNEEED
jgi:NO-binding membrane sensor protein with MHYT domain